MLARWTLGVGEARVSLDATVGRQSFEESSNTVSTLWLGGGVANHLRVLARWTLGVGEAGVGFKATA